MNNAPFSVAILGFDLKFAAEPRVRNEILALLPRAVVDGYGVAPTEGLADFYAVRKLPRQLYRVVKVLGGILPKLRVWFEQVRRRDVAAKVATKYYNLLIAHNIQEALFALSTGVPFVFHSHEYLPRQFDGSMLFRLTEMRYRRACLTEILRTARLLVVEGEAVGQRYSKEFGVPEAKICVMPSVSRYREQLAPSARRSGIVRLIHHGILVPERGLEVLIHTAMELGAGYQLTLMGDGPERYLKKLGRLARMAGNVAIVPPVAFEQIEEALYGHDLGLIVFGSPHYHHKYMTVPSKFWQCLQARVPVLVSGESAMAQYVRESGCGVIAESNDASGYANAIRGLTQDGLDSMRLCCESRAWKHSLESWLPSFAERIRCVSEPRAEKCVARPQGGD